MNATSELKLAIFIAASLLIAIAQKANAGDYDAYIKAYGEGLRLSKTPRSPAAEKAFLEAAKLAPDEEGRLTAHSGLRLVYDDALDFEKKLAVNELLVERSIMQESRTSYSQDAVRLIAQQKKLELCRDRYRTRLTTAPKDAAALNILVEINQRLGASPEQATFLRDQRDRVNRELAEATAKRQEAIASKDPSQQGYRLILAAEAWVDAGEKDKGLEAVNKSIASPKGTGPRGEMSVAEHRLHAGRLLLRAGEPALAIEHYEIAIKHAEDDDHRQFIQELIAEAKVSIEMKQSRK
jgi:hypothetical protein